MSCLHAFPEPSQQYLACAICHVFVCADVLWGSPHHLPAKDLHFFLCRLLGKWPTSLIHGGAREDSAPICVLQQMRGVTRIQVLTWASVVIDYLFSVCMSVAETCLGRSQSHGIDVQMLTGNLSCAALDENLMPVEWTLAF